MLSAQQLVLILIAGSLLSFAGPAISETKLRNLIKRNDQDQPLDDSNNNNSPHYEPLTQLHESSPSFLDSTSSDSSAASAGSASAATPSSKLKGKRTLYACEKEQLQIECQLGESIQLIRANYGRFSIQICNEHGQLDWKVNCMSPDSYQRIANR